MLVTFKLISMPSGSKKSQGIAKWKLDILSFKGKTELDVYTVKKGDSAVIQVRTTPIHSFH